MAFVQKLPRQVTMTEGCYGSKLNLRYYPDSSSCDGTYAPVVETGDIDIETPSTGPGHAVIWAQMMDGRDDGEAVLKGEWSHVIGGLKKQGTFEMKVDEVTGSAEGWWSLPGDQERNPWNWYPGDTEAFLNNTSKMRERSRLRSSLSSRLDRNKSFFDELLEDEQRALSIARYGVICAWIFLFQTAMALAMAFWKGFGVSAAILQCTFQAVYSLTYFSFLVIYSRMTTLPPLDYVLGVLLYTMGYFCFFLLYVFGFILAEEEEMLGPLTNWLYVSGSLLFLVGSVCLVCATIPPAAPMINRAPTWCEHLARFSLWDQNAALFWGSMAFLIGSAFFSLDSIWTVAHPTSKPTTLGFWCAVLGYAFFTPGRVYFLWGSTTDACDIFLRGAEAARCFPQALPCICRGPTAVAPDDCSDFADSGCLACGNVGCGMCKLSSTKEKNIDAEPKRFPQSSWEHDDMHGSMDAAKASLSLPPASPPVATAPAPLLPPPSLPLNCVACGGLGCSMCQGSRTTDKLPQHNLDAANPNCPACGGQGCTTCKSISAEVAQQNAAPTAAMLGKAAPVAPPFPHRLAPLPFPPSPTPECPTCGSMCKCLS